MVVMVYVKGAGNLLLIVGLKCSGKPACRHENPKGLVKKPRYATEPRAALKARRVWYLVSYIHRKNLR